MVNMFMAVGRLKTITDDYVIISCTNPNNREVNLKIFLRGKINDTTKEYCNIGDVCGIKGYFEPVDDEKKIILVADRVTFLSKASDVKEEDDCE